MWKRAGYYDSLGLRRLLAVDHRGHGRSTTPDDVEGFRPEELVADVVAVLDDAKVERAVFVGYSAGAAVLCRAAGAHPQRCLGLIGLGFCPEASDADEENPWPRRVRELGVRKIIEQMARAESETPPAWFLENLCETSDDAFSFPIVAAQHAPPLWETLADVTVPTLLICGSEEVDAASLRSAERRAPDGSSARLDSYGHLQVFWHADVTGAVIAKWLDEHDW
jgi:pimeloyl-ACP methyl ester carboxylesterase